MVPYHQRDLDNLRVFFVWYIEKFLFAIPRVSTQNQGAGRRRKPRVDSNTITNGISLCPNLHRAFDRGLISLDTEYRVLVKPFTEEKNFYPIKQFEGKQILLPNNIQYFPSQENLAAHRFRHNFI